MQGWKNSTLTNQGINNAIALGKALEDMEFVATYTSTSERTIETARLILGRRDLDVHTDENLREIHLGEWEGKTHEELEALYPEQYKNFWENPGLYEPAGGETFDQFINRSIYALNNIISKHKSGNILVVTHFITIKSLLMYVKGKSIKDLSGPSFIHDTSLTILEIQNGMYHLLSEGDVTHLNPVTSV